MVEIRRVTAEDIEARVQAALDSLRPSEQELRSRIEAGTACPCEESAWREIEAARWLGGSD